MSARSWVVFSVVCAVLPAALACGTCAEDKIAATYDHATAQRAAASGQVMVYCELGGRWDAGQVKRAAARVRGVDARTLRTAREPAALSFALDAKQQSARAAVLALQAALPAGTRIGLVRVVGAGS
jgi:hypothetical protein